MITFLILGFNSKRLLRVADKYQVPALKDKCEKALGKCIKISNAIDLFTTAHDVSAQHLLTVASKFIVKHQQELCNTEEWKSKVD